MSEGDRRLSAADAESGSNLVLASAVNRHISREENILGRKRERREIEVRGRKIIRIRISDDFKGALPSKFL